MATLWASIQEMKMLREAVALVLVSLTTVRLCLLVLEAEAHIRFRLRFTFISPRRFSSSGAFHQCEVCSRKKHPDCKGGGVGFPR